MTIYQLIAGLAGGFLLGYLTSYFNEKGKNRALLSDLKRMTEEKEAITTKFQLDLTKRKYQYESKKEQYFKYFNLLDQFSSEGNAQMQERFLPIVTKFTNDFLQANLNKKKEFSATGKFSEEVHKLLLESNEKLIKIKNETGTLKLIAGAKVLELLDDLEYYYTVSSEKGGEMMNKMAELIVARKETELKQKQSELEALGSLINETRLKLIEQVRLELDEI